MRDVLEQWATGMRASGLAASTVRRRLSVGRRWLDVVGDRWPDATPGELAAYLEGERVAPNTLAADRSALACLYRWGQLTGRVQGSPVDGVPAARKRRGVPRPAPHAVVCAACRCEDARIARACALMAYGGARCCEVSRCTCGDVDFAAGVVYLEGKGGRRRWVPMVGPMRALVGGLDGAPAGEPVFPRGDGRAGPASPERVSRVVGDWLAECSRPAPAVTAHQLRHYYAAQVHQRTGSLEVVQLALGHASISTTQVYAALGNGALAGLEDVWPAERASHGFGSAGDR